jgi:DNA invertase Pin-like site-specific DNA recombinase
MLVGYARVSTTEHHLDLQRDALTQAGCGRLFIGTASGAKAERPGLAQALNYLREGDVLAVWKLDRLGRSLKDLLEIVTAPEQRGIGFKSLQESMDTTTPGGKLIFHVFATLAEFERGVIRERTHAGLKAARARGRHGGRRYKLPQKGKELAITMLADPKNRIDDICATVGISRATLTGTPRRRRARRRKPRRHLW